MRTNLKQSNTERTHGGAVSFQISPAAELRRTTMACMLFEDQFYESGEDAATRMKALARKVSFEDAAKIAIDAREKMKLRHAPLFIAREMLRYHTGRKVGDLISRIIQRPDELGELLALYWKDGKDQPLPAQLKFGLARAFKKFNAYQLAKWNKDGAVKLRDVLFLAHVRPDNEEQAALFKQVAENTLPTPDTWEVALSGGAGKKEAFERLIAEKKLGALALLRNLRGMLEAGVSEVAIRQGLADMRVERVLPFRFISAARHAPRLEDVLEQAMFRCLSDAPKLPGKTVLVLDTSGSMGSAISNKSDLSRLQTAAALSILVREVCETPVIYCTAGNDMTEKHATMLIPSRRGFALADYVAGGEVRRKIGGGGIFLVQCMKHIQEQEKTADRVIVITDEQDCDHKLQPDQAAAFGKRNYLVNVASYKNGIAYKKFLHIDGWSEAVIDYIRASEEQTNA